MCIFLFGSWRFRLNGLFGCQESCKLVVYSRFGTVTSTLLRRYIHKFMHMYIDDVHRA